MATHHPIRKNVAAPTPVIPDKLYFRIGDVARLCEVPAYVLRFWETEFPNLKPNKGGTGQRLYRKKDVETALRIKHLLYDLGYTIPGARQVFKTDARPTELATSLATDPSITPASAQKSVILGEATQHSEVAQSKNPEALHPAATAGAIASTKLRALREELLALHAQLSAPVAATPVLVRTPLRPRLVAESKLKPRLEPKPEAKSEAKLGLVALAGQQDLFPAE